jgi:putative transposase
MPRSGERLDPQAGFEFVKQNRAEFSVATMCRVLGLSTSRYYAWLDRPPSARAVANEGLLRRVREIHAFSRPSYGKPRMYAELREEGVLMKRKRVARLMKADGLIGITRRKKWRTTKRDRGARPAPDLVNRDLTADRPDERWVADITYVPTSSGFLSLAVAVAAWSRLVLGWSMEPHRKTGLVLSALHVAVTQRWPEGVILHSDQGTQYTSIVFGLRCKRAGVRPPMGSVGGVSENGLSLWELLRNPRVRAHRAGAVPEPGRGPSGRLRLDRGLVQPHRRHSTLGQMSPLNYEKHRAKAA